MLITKPELRIKLTLMFLKQLLKQHEKEEPTSELATKLAIEAAKQAELSLRTIAFNWVK